MKKRPILFSGEMVRAILDGRKTQTRRVVKPEPRMMKDQQVWPNKDGHWSSWVTGELWTNHKCPYGQAGDRLWVREKWASADCFDDTMPSKIPTPFLEGMPGSPCVQYAVKPIHAAVGWNAGRWRPSIHMPRWASRITLEITDVRVERVQDITAKDVEAEGVDCKWNKELSPQKCFAELWDTINGKKYPWDHNPWVWVVEFKLVEGE